MNSGSILDTEAQKRGVYDDVRSRDKGVEPEGVALLDVAGRTYAFVGLERATSSAVAVFDVTNPYETKFVDMIVTPGDRNISADRERRNRVRSGPARIPRGAMVEDRCFLAAVTLTSVSPRRETKCVARAENSSCA